MAEFPDHDPKDRSSRARLWCRIRHGAVYVVVALVTATIVQVLAVMGR